MRVAAYTALHYGKDYLPYVIRSIIDQVEKYIVLYTPTPSYGHNTGEPCPETRDELMKICIDEAGNKLHWVDIYQAYREGDHRNRAFGFVNGFDLLAVVDADEVWEPSAFRAACDYAMGSTAPSIGVKHDGWYHFWRSFNEYCTDGFSPIRFHNLHKRGTAQDLGCPGTIYHFGYAQPAPLMRYKWSCHGHQDELRAGWLDEIWGNYEKGKTERLHPSSHDIWIHTNEFDKSTMPDFLKEHPFYNLDRI